MEKVKKAAVLLAILSMVTGVVAARDEVIKNKDKIMKLYREWKKEFDKEVEKEVDEFINN